MIVYTDTEGRIKAVGTTNDTSLTRQEINDDANPFKDWSNSRICCYKVQIQDGYVIMMTPYINSATLDAVDLMGRQMEEITPYTVTKTAYIDDTEIVFNDVPSGNLSVYMQGSDGNYPDFTVERSGDRVTVSFEALEQVTTVTISIL